MRIAVLGANSFSGSAFVAVARAADHDVLPMSRPIFDLNSSPRIFEALDRFKPQVVVNYAALNVVAESWRYSSHYYLTNVIGVTQLANWLAKTPPEGFERFVQVSTPEVYGNLTYWASGPLGPNVLYEPSTPYAVSRAAADMHLRCLASSFGFPVCFTRTVNVYGPAQQPYRIIPKTVLKILRGDRLKLEGGGESSRSFIHVKDMALGTLEVALRGRAGSIYHFATPDTVKIRDLVRMICTLMGVTFEDVVEEVNDRPGKDRMYFLDWSSSYSDLGWEPKVGLESGLEETVAWFKAHAADYAGHSLEYEHRP